MEKNHITILISLCFITILACTSALSFLSHNPEHLLVFDDSYITLKFAANFFKYNGITYDGTSYLTGATSPLHIIGVALLGLFFSMETASLAVGIIFFILSSLIVYMWVIQMYGEKKVALLAGVMMATSGLLVFDSLNGLETTTFIFFTLLTFYLHYVYEHKVYYIITLFLSVLARPEGWFLASALWVSQVIDYVIWHNKKVLRNLFISLSIFIFLCIPYFLLYFYYTGSLLPNTAFAKSVFFAEFQIHSPRIWMLKHGVELFYQELLYPLPLIIFPLILFARKVIRLPYLWWYYGIFYLCYFIVFPGATLHYWCRYQHIFIPLIIIGISGGTFELLRLYRKKFVQIAMVILIGGSIIYNQGMSLNNARDIYLKEISCTQNTLIDLAMWLKHNTPENSLIALHDIGAVGYFSDRRILDLVGLINPEVSKYYWDKSSKKLFHVDERRVIDYLKEKTPDYLVVRVPDWERYLNLFQSANQKHFRQVYTSDLIFPVQARYKVFKCNWES